MPEKHTRKTENKSQMIEMNAASLMGTLLILLTCCLDVRREATNASTGETEPQQQKNSAVMPRFPEGDGGGIRGYERGQADAECT